MPRFIVRTASRVYQALHHRKLLIQYWLVCEGSRCIICEIKGSGQVRSVLAPPRFLSRLWVLHGGDMPSERIRCISDEMYMGY